MSKYAYVFCMFLGDSYLPGVLVVAYSIFKTKTINDIVCMVTPDVSDVAIGKMTRLGIKVVKINYLHSNSYLDERPRLKKRWPDIELYCSKFNCLSLVQYKKIFLLDIDMLVQYNIDHIFNISTPAGRIALKISDFYTIPVAKDGTDLKQEMSNIMLSNGTGSLDGGCLLLEPNLQMFEDYKTYLTIFDPRKFNTAMGDDELSIFSFYVKKNITWKYLNLKWSCAAWKYYGLCTLKDSLILNFIGTEKPWKKDMSKFDDLKPWYDMYNEMNNTIN